jgi:hypothetical protein
VETNTAGELRPARTRPIIAVAGLSDIAPTAVQRHSRR